MFGPVKNQCTCSCTDFLKPIDFSISLFTKDKSFNNIFFFPDSPFLLEKRIT